MTLKDLKGMKVKSRVTGLEYTIIKARNSRRRGPEIKINNYSGWSGISWWPMDRFKLINNSFTFMVVVK